MQALKDNPNQDLLKLVVDLKWAESLSDKELSSLAKQVCYVYGRVKASWSPPSLTLASYRGRAAEILQRWKFTVTVQHWCLDRVLVLSYSLLEVRPSVWVKLSMSLWLSLDGMPVLL